MRGAAPLGPVWKDTQVVKRPVCYTGRPERARGFESLSFRKQK